MLRSVVALSAVTLLLTGCGSDDDAPAAAVTAAATTEPAQPVVTTVPATTTPATTAPATTPATSAPATTVPAVARMRGTAYTFNTPDPIAGATVRVEEFPDVSAVTAADGSYELELPAGATVTPYIEAAGHGGIHVQQFTLDADHDGTEVDGVNFQTPSEPIYDALRGLIAGFVGRDPFEGGCVIVTTVGDARMVGMPFSEFIEFHPHGVEGATVQLDPPAREPIYFNADVVPDINQLTSSNDGGVLFANVPPGTYTLSATHPTVDFVTVPVRCEQGWVVNANPVHGLHAIPAG